MAAVFEALETGFTEPIRDPLWGHIYLTAELAALTASPAFAKLARIQQLGPTASVYPGATHTRAAHSFGVYHLARRLLRSLLERGADAWTSPLGARSFLAAALLHDLGHFPYAHSLKELPLEDHEALTGKLILSPPLRELVGKAGADPYLTAAIVDKALPTGGNAETLFYRRLLSGVLDPDKLDYLNRDARCCGVPYGAQDVDFIYSRLIPHAERGVDIDSKGIPSVEAILFAKYLMYRSVYWHRGVRSATAMVKAAVKSGLEDGILASEELYGLDDAGLFALLASRAHPAFALAAAVREGKSFQVIAEFPFDEAVHRGLEDLQTRSLFEEELAGELSAALSRRIVTHEIIIDLPEPISFETGLLVADTGRPFSESTTVFSDATVAAFVRSLRVVRICANQEVAEAVAASSEARGLLQGGGKWLHSIQDAQTATRGGGVDGNP